MGGVDAPHAISIEDGYARFALRGFITVPLFVAGLEQVMLQCQQSGQTRLLVDLRFVEHPPITTTDRYDLSHATAEFWDRSILMVWVARPDQMDPDRFAQKVAANRGLFLAAYTDEKTALEWLLRPQSPDAFRSGA